MIDGSGLKKIVRQIIEGLPKEAEKYGYAVTTENETVTVEDLKTYRKKNSSLSSINQIISLIETCNNIEKEDSYFDQENEQIVAQNGIIDLKTGRIREHDPNFLSTRTVSVPYDPDAKCPNYIKFIDLISNHNASLAHYLQVQIGYFFTGITREQEIYIYHGYGSNGKSTLLNVLLKIADSYGMQTPAYTLMSNKSKGIACDLPRLKKARIVAASETNQGETFDEARIKLMTGGEQIVSRLLFQNLESYLPQFKVVIAVNILPEIRGFDHGITRRIVVIPFDNTFCGEGRDKDMKDQLELELPGIFAWIVEGAKEYFQNGLPKCEAVTKATDMYIKEMDKVESFLEDTCIVDIKNNKSRIPLNDLWEMSNEWNRKTCNDTFKKKIFSEHLLRKGFKKARVNNTWFWLGIKPKIKGIQ